MSVRRPARRYILACVVAGATAIACSDSTAPKPTAKITNAGRERRADVDPTSCRSGWIIANGHVECVPQ